MVSRRSRSKNSVGSRLSEIATKVDKAAKSAGLGSGEVESQHLAENAVDRTALAPNSVGPEQIDRGAVGTENLGIVNEVVADSDLNFITPGNVRVNGVPIGGVDVNPTPPVGPSSGDLWFNSTDGSLYVYYNDGTSSQWVEAGSTSGGYRLGVAYPWAVTTIPGWALELNGQAVSRTTYSGLFALWGTTFGVGNGTTTFNVPDWTGRVPVGYKSGDANFGTLGAAVGAATHSHTLTTAVAAIYVALAKYRVAVSNWVATNTSNLTAPGGSSTSQGNGVALEGSTDASSSIQPSVVVKWIVCAVTSSGDFDTVVQAALVARTTALETFVSSAQQIVVPASVAVGSGSASIAADGVVTFTGCSSVSLNNVFNGLGMDIYDVIVTLAGSVTMVVSTRMRIAGVNLATGIYNYVGVLTTNATGPTRLSTFAATSMGFWVPNASAAPLSFGTMRFYQPGKVAITHGRMLSNTAASDRYLWDEYGDSGGSATAQDGFSLITSTGTISGTIKVVKIA